MKKILLLVVLAMLMSCGSYEKNCVNYLKPNLKDPKSFELVSSEIKPMDDISQIVILTYRAKNSFGALDICNSTFLVDIGTKEVVSMF